MHQIHAGRRRQRHGRSDRRVVREAPQDRRTRERRRRRRLRAAALRQVPPRAELVDEPRQLGAARGARVRHVSAPLRQEAPRPPQCERNESRVDEAGRAARASTSGSPLSTATAAAPAPTRRRGPRGAAPAAKRDSAAAARYSPAAQQRRAAHDCAAVQRREARPRLSRRCARARARAAARRPFVIAATRDAPRLAGARRRDARACKRGNASRWRRFKAAANAARSRLFDWHRRASLIKTRCFWELSFVSGTRRRRTAPGAAVDEHAASQQRGEGRAPSSPIPPDLRELQARRLTALSRRSAHHASNAARSFGLAGFFDSAALRVRRFKCTIASTRRRQRAITNGAPRPARRRRPPSPAAAAGRRARDFLS